MLKSILQFSPLLLTLPLNTQAEEALIAVATNFAGVAQRIETEFESISTHRVTLVTGSTGKLYAQIVNGAPFDALLAADQERPRLLEASGLAVTGSGFTFAIGRLVLASMNANLIGFDLRETLTRGGTGKLAIANPELAPYGLASRKTLQSLHLWEGAREQIVMGENIGQTHALVATRNAELGFIALSQVVAQRSAGTLSYVEVPEDLHEPIRQEATLLRHGNKNAAAIDFLVFLRSKRAREMLSEYGYGFDQRFAD